MKITLKHCISPNSRTQGVFIGTREERGQGTNPGLKYGRDRTRTAAPRPRFHGHTVAPRAALRAARCLVCPLSGSVPDFWFLAPGFDESALLVIGYDISL